MKKIGVGILGCGVIGAATVNNLIKGAGDITARSGIEIEIKAIAELNPERKKAVPEPASALFTDRLDEVIASDDIDIIVELIGGDTIALKAVESALKNGKHVVTANKYLLAKHGEGIYKIAVDNGVEIGFEASVAGAVPIIRTLKEGIAGGEIKSIKGIINGTANYILTKMTESDADFAEVLGQAQKLGYAEADPTYDIEGNDAAHKIAIIASLGFNTPVALGSVYMEGIIGLKPEDFDFAKQFGKVIKLLAIARLDNGEVDLRVHPAMLPCSEPLAQINGVTNAVKLEVSHAHDLMLVGPGAGGDPTSSAVIADIVEIARNIASGSVGRVSPVAFGLDARLSLPVKAMDNIETGYYLRFHVEDRPGVLSKITGILGDNGISVESALQKNVNESVVPLVIFTHTAREKSVRQAVEKIDELPTTREKTVIVRLENGE